MPNQEVLRVEESLNLLRHWNQCGYKLSTYGVVASHEPHYLRSCDHLDFADFHYQPGRKDVDVVRPETLRPLTRYLVVTIQEIATETGPVLYGQGIFLPKQFTQVTMELRGFNSKMFMIDIEDNHFNYTHGGVHLPSFGESSRYSIVECWLDAGRPIICEDMSDCESSIEKKFLENGKPEHGIKFRLILEWNTHRLVGLVLYLNSYRVLPLPEHLRGRLE